MDDTSTADSEGLSPSEPTATSILGLKKGSLRFRLHGSSQKAHVVLRRVERSSSSKDGSEPGKAIYFSLFAQKRIEVKPGKEILLTVSSADGRFKDRPIVFGGDLCGPDESSDDEDNTQVAEDDAEAAPVGLAMPPKMRRTWTKRLDEVSPVINRLQTTHASIGIQAQPELATHFTQTQLDTSTASIQVKPAYSSSSIQAYPTSATAATQTSDLPATTSASIQTNDYFLDNNSSTGLNKKTPKVHSGPARDRSLSPMEMDSPPVSPILGCASLMSPPPPSPRPLTTVSAPSVLDVLHSPVVSIAKLKTPGLSSSAPSAITPTSVTLDVSHSPTLKVTKLNSPIPTASRRPSIARSFSRDVQVLVATEPPSEPPATMLPLPPPPQNLAAVANEDVLISTPIDPPKETPKRLTIAAPALSKSRVSPVVSIQDMFQLGASSKPPPPLTEPAPLPSAPPPPIRRTVANPFVSGGFMTEFVGENIKTMDYKGKAKATSDSKVSPALEPTTTVRKDPALPPLPKLDTELPAEPQSPPNSAAKSSQAGSPTPAASPSTTQPNAVASSSKALWDRKREFSPARSPRQSSSAFHDRSVSPPPLRYGNRRSSAFDSPYFSGSAGSSYKPSKSQNGRRVRKNRRQAKKNSYVPGNLDQMPDARSLAYITPGPSSNPLGIRPSATLAQATPMRRGDAPPEKKRVVVGNGWPLVKHGVSPPPRRASRFGDSYRPGSPPPRRRSPSVPPTDSTASNSTPNLSNILPYSSPSPPSFTAHSPKPRSGLPARPSEAGSKDDPDKVLSAPLASEPDQLIVTKLDNPDNPVPSRKRKRAFKWPTESSMHSVALKGTGDVGVLAVAISSDGSQFAASCSDRTIRIWNSHTRAEVARLAHNAAIVALSWMDSDSGVVSLGEDGIISKWTRTGQNHWQWAKMIDTGNEHQAGDDAMCLAYMRDRIAVAYPRSGVKVWFWAKGTWLPQRSILRQGVSAIRFVDDGDALLGGTKDGVLWFCEVPNGTLRAYAFLKSKISGIDVSASGTHALVAQTGGSAHLVGIRDDNKGKIEQVYTNQDMEGATCVFGTAFANKGQAVLFGTAEGCLLVWDKAKGGVSVGWDHGTEDTVQAVANFDGGASKAGFVVSGTKNGQLAWWAQPSGGAQADGSVAKRQKTGT